MLFRWSYIPLLLILATPPVNAQNGTRSRADDAENYDSRADLLADRVGARLARSGSLSGSDITVRVIGSKVVLEGSVSDQEAKERASRLARRSVGVASVDNQLRIDLAGVEKNRKVRVPDDQLSKQIAEKLVEKHFSNAHVERDWLLGWEVEGNGWEVEVDVDDGDVILAGDVQTPGRIAEVLRTVRAVPGVRTVTSELAARTYDRPIGLWPDWGYHPYPIR